MELEYRDPTRRGRFIFAAGLVLALIAGGAAFVLITRAQEQAGQAGLQRVAIVVAKVQIAARKPIEAGDVELREVPIDPTNQSGVFSDPARVLGLVPGVTILAGQPIYANFLASQAQGAGFSILEPGETIGPDSEVWRAISLTVPDDRAIGGMIRPGDTVDVFVTTTVAVPDDLAAAGRYYTERSTKITYQDVLVLGKATTFYVVKVKLATAEEISHLQAAGTASFSLALRPVQDRRIVDVSRLGETTNLIIQRYGLPIPQVYPPRTGPIPTTAPATPAPSKSPAATASPSP